MLRRAGSPQATIARAAVISMRMDSGQRLMNHSRCLLNVAGRKKSSCIHAIHAVAKRIRLTAGVGTSSGARDTVTSCRAQRHASSKRLSDEVKMIAEDDYNAFWSGA